MFAMKAELKKARFEAWDDWMHEFSDGLNEAGVDWEQLPSSPRPVTEPHGTRMADTFCMMLRERDAAIARAEKAEEERDVLTAECASISAEFGLPPTIRPAEGEIARFLAERDAAWARVKKLEEAIRIHGECFTACRRCGEETPNEDDDVCLALAEEAKP